VLWGARAIDLDLLLYDREVIHDADLTVPHPRMAFRRFVLAPAVEVAGDFVHPQIGWTIEQLLEHLNKSPHYVAVSGTPRVGKTQLARRVALATGAAFCPDPELDTISEAAPPGIHQRVAVELTLSRARSAALEQFRSRPVPEFISDFWLEQSWAYARTSETEEQQAAFRENLDKMLVGAVRPTLVVLLTGAHLARFEPLAAQLLALASRPGRGPFLVLDADDFERAVDETAAALLAMR
jgi:hypothetical protein